MFSWIRQRPRLVGRILILIGVILAGFLSKNGFLPQPEGTWRAYSISSIEKLSVPRRGKVERSYRLKSDFTTIDIDSSAAAFFDHNLMNTLQRPVSVEVYSDHEPSSRGEIHAEGIRLVDGQMILDPSVVQQARRPQEILGVVICSVMLISGIGLQLFRSKRPKV